MTLQEITKKTNKELIKVDCQIDETIGVLEETLEYIEKYVTDCTIKEDLTDNLIKKALDILTDI